MEFAEYGTLESGQWNFEIMGQWNLDNGIWKLWDSGIWTMEFGDYGTVESGQWNLEIMGQWNLGRAEVLRGLRNFLNMDRPEHHRIDRLKERGVEKGSGRHSTFQGRERSVFNQTNIGTVSRATFGRLLRDGAERVWAFPSATMPS